MILSEETMKIIPNFWVTARQLADLIAKEQPVEFKKPPFNGDIKALSMALGPALNGLKNRGKIQDNGVLWPATKEWRRSQTTADNTFVKPAKTIENTSVAIVARALVNLHVATDENAAVELLASRTVREHKEEFDALIEQSEAVHQAALKIRSKILGKNSEPEVKS